MGAGTELIAVAFVLGALVAFLGCRWLLTNKPRLASRIGLSVGSARRSEVGDEGPPAIEPHDIPDAADPTEQAKIDAIPHQQLRRLVSTLRTWAPRRHQAEDAFQRSFRKHLLKNGYAEGEVERHRRIPWTARDRAPTDSDKRAVPDFMVEGLVLVEIKRNITGSGESDRSLGQMQRYSIAWRRTGPALLIVCNEYDEGLRVHVEKTVRGWKDHGAPVMAYFARHPSVLEGDDEFPAGAWD